MGETFRDIQEDVVRCRACPRLVAWREEVAREKRRAYRDEEYWGRPVPAFGDPDARLLVLGLAPGAHGANRTGRMFTGDGSGDWLFRALHRAGFASSATSRSRDDGLELSDAVVTAAGRCAPPSNRPLPEELGRCAPFLLRELRVLRHVRVVLALGAIAWDAYLRAVPDFGGEVPRPRPRFGHGNLVRSGLPHVLLGSYHPSRQNTSTGRLTERMLDDVLGTARALLDEVP